MLSFKNVPDNSHYKNHWWFGSSTPWDLMGGRELRVGSAFKYVFRYRDKGKPVEDVKKALVALNHYFDRPIPLLERFEAWRAKRVADIAVKHAENRYLSPEKTFVHPGGGIRVELPELRALIRLYWGDIRGAQKEIETLLEELEKGQDD